VCVFLAALLCFVGARLKRAECLRKRELANDDEYTTLSALLTMVLTRLNHP